MSRDLVRRPTSRKRQRRSPIPKPGRPLLRQMAGNGPRIACNASPPRWTVESTCRVRKSLLRKIWPDYGGWGASASGSRPGPARRASGYDPGSLKSLLRHLACSWLRFRRIDAGFYGFCAIVRSWAVFGPLWPIGVGAKKGRPGVEGGVLEGVNPGFREPVSGVRPKRFCGFCGVRRHPSRAFRWHPGHRWKARGQD